MALTFTEEIHTDKSNRKVHVIWRYVIAFSGFFAMINSYNMRSHISVTLVAMVNSTGDKEDDTSNSSCGFTSDSSTDDDQGEFHWSSQIQGIIQGGFFWGYMIPQILAGRLAELYGGKRVIFVGGLIGTFATLIGPVAARTHVGFFIATRVLCGLGLSVFTPSLHAIIARWCPPNERSRMSAFVYSGNQVGTVIALGISGVLCEYGPDGGWPWPFYVFGMLSGIWLILWMVLVYNLPNEHPWISDREKAYIARSLGETLETRKAKPVPWKAIMKSRPFWSLLIVHFGQNWGFYTLLTELPSYMSHILGFNISQNGLLSCLPYIVMMVIGYVSSLIGDLLIKKKVLQVATVRKSFNSFALYGTAFFLLIVTFLKCQKYAIYSMLLLAVAFDGGIYAGFQINHVDLSPNFAGTLQGLTNTVGSIPGIVSPYITGVITEDETRKSWSIIFYIAIGILVVIETQYVLFGEGTVQPWNDEDSSESFSDENSSKEKREKLSIKEMGEKLSIKE